MIKLLMIKIYQQKYVNKKKLIIRYIKQVKLMRNKTLVLINCK